MDRKAMFEDPTPAELLAVEGGSFWSAIWTAAGAVFGAVFGFGVGGIVGGIIGGLLGGGGGAVVGTFGDGGRPK